MNTYEVVYYNKSTKLFYRKQFKAKTKQQAIEKYMDEKFTSDEYVEIKKVSE